MQQAISYAIRAPWASSPYANRANHKQNQLLGAIPEAEWKRVAPHLTAVDLGLGDVIYESGSAQPHVYFPTDSIISLLYGRSE